MLSEVRATELVVDVDPRVRLAGTLALPAGAARAPVVIGVHGSSGGTRDATLLRHLVETLPAHGIGAFVFDRRGEGASTGPPGLGSFEQLANDVSACVDRLAREPGVDPDRIGLWSHSQGGWITPLAAAENSHVRYLIAVAPAGVTAAEQMKYAAYRQVQLAGYPDADADRAVALRDRIDEFFRGNGSRDEADQLYLEARKEPWFGRIFLPDPSSAGSQWPTIMDLDIAPTLRQIQVPVLLVFGEDDRWVPIGDTLEVWRRALPDREAMDVVTIPGAGHSMTVAEDPDDWMEAGPLAPGYERELLAWLRDHVA